MSYIEKLQAKDIMVFARKNVINKFKKLQTLDMETEKVQQGWLVNHNYLAQSGKKAQEGFLFTDFSVLYMAGTEDKNVPDFDFMSKVQDEYREYMCEKIGSAYATKLAEMEAEAEEIMSQFNLHYQKRKETQSQIEEQPTEVSSIEQNVTQSIKDFSQER